MVVELDIVNGLMFGIGHLGGDDDDDYEYMIVICFAMFQIAFTKLK